MSQLLKPKQKVKTNTGMSVEVEHFLGGGGQGEVYRADLGGKAVALKWYFPTSATSEQERALAKLVKMGAPNDRFLWPQDLTHADGVQGYGYIMPLREPRYKNIVDLMKRRAEPTFRQLATACMNMADSYYQLHSKGLCYRDISFGNVFFDPKNGDVLICDNDNVTFDGAAVSGVLGTPKFMAPEVVTGRAAPSTETDLYSLSVLLFYMLMMHHPLEGALEANIKCLDLPAMNKLYGSNPLFIYDPNDASNRPVPGYQDNVIIYWDVYPEILKQFFTRAFTEGIHKPADGRVRETEWRAAMSSLHDAIFYCNHCKAENFYDQVYLQQHSGQPRLCWNPQCQREVQLPYRLRVGRDIMMLNYDTKLYPHHIDSRRRYDFSKPVGSVNQNPNDPTVWGIKNESNDRWIATTSEGNQRDVDIGRSVTLAVGTKIQFGSSEGEVRY